MLPQYGSGRSVLVPLLLMGSVFVLMTRRLCAFGDRRAGMGVLRRPGQGALDRLTGVVLIGSACAWRPHDAEAQSWQGARRRGRRRGSDGSRGARRFVARQRWARVTGMSVIAITRSTNHVHLPAADDRAGSCRRSRAASVVLLARCDV